MEITKLYMALTSLTFKSCDLATQDVCWVGHATSNLAVSHELHSKTFAHSTCNQVHHGIIVVVIVFQQLAHKAPVRGVANARLELLASKSYKSCLAKLK
jgi:hypothetical protein